MLERPERGKRKLKFPSRSNIHSIFTCFVLISLPFISSPPHCRRQQQIINTSKHLFPTTKADVESLLNYSLNKKRYASQIPPEARHYRQPISAPRTHKPSNSSSSSTNDSISPRLSLAPSDAGGFEMYRQNRNRILTVTQVERHPSTLSAKSLRPLHLCPSQASLMRSKSLNIQSTIKHSPNCRLNRKVLN